MQQRPFAILTTALMLFTLLEVRASERENDDRSLIGYWKLQGDCRDYSGGKHHGINHGVNLATSEFSGQGSYIEVLDSPAWEFGDQDFSIAAWIDTSSELTDTVGDIVTKFDADGLHGFNFSINSSAPGYNSASNTRHLFFGLDNNSPGRWTDCGHPNGKTHVSDALTVFNGDLYVGTTDGPDEADWAHVYRYKGGQDWEDCGRVGHGTARGVYAMVVHDGTLYAATSATHGAQPATIDCGRVYRYQGGQQWEDLGQPGQNQRLHALASFRGKLYVVGFNIGPEPGHCYVYEGKQQWKQCGEFKGWPCALAVHDGRLYTGNPQAGIYAYDGNEWIDLGNPNGSWSECQQIHSMGVYKGELHVGSWPHGKIAVRRDDRWIDLGRLGDATEVVGITTYNGGLYAGTIPRAEIFRWQEPGVWVSMRRLFDPPGFEPVPVGSGAPTVEDWSRASSLAVYDGKLFSTTATCYRTMLGKPLPNDIRGKVFAFSSGSTIGHDRDLGAGWKHVAAVRSGANLKLYINGTLVASNSGDARLIDVSNNAPLRIGFGPQSHFCGKIREVRLYDRALTDDDLKTLHQHQATLASQH